MGAGGLPALGDLAGDFLGGFEGGQRDGLPFVLLSAGAPMFQRWFASTRHPAADNPYVLYVASNLGSFVALLAYPTLIEPWLRVSEQSRTWLGLYYALLVLVAAVWLDQTRRRARNQR